MLASLLNGEITQEEYINCNNIKILDFSLPKRIYGFIFNYRNINFIIVNKCISIEKHKYTILHEFAHLELNHLSKLRLNFKIEGIEDEADRYIDFLLDCIKN